MSEITCDALVCWGGNCGGQFIGRKNDWNLVDRKKNKSVYIGSV